MFLTGRAEFGRIPEWIRTRTGLGAAPLHSVCTRSCIYKPQVEPDTQTYPFGYHQEDHDPRNLRGTGGVGRYLYGPKTITDLRKSLLQASRRTQVQNGTIWDAKGILGLGDDTGVEKAL